MVNLDLYSDWIQIDIFIMIGSRSKFFHGWIRIPFKVGSGSLSWSDLDLDLYHDRIRIPFIVESNSLSLSDPDPSWLDPDLFHGRIRIPNENAVDLQPCLYLVKPKTTLRGK